MAPKIKLAVGVITWNDGDEMLRKSIGSVAAIADELLIADGLIEGVGSGGLPPITEGLLDGRLDAILEGAELDAGLEPGALPPPYVTQHSWKGQAEKRTWLLNKARTLKCDWLLQLDADERLHNPEKLAAWLPSWAYDAFPIPFQVEPHQLLCATWKCLRVDAWARIVAGGAFIEHTNGTVYCVVPAHGRPPDGSEGILPWISHHPDERPAERRAIRLGELEEILEPPPMDSPYFEPPSLEARSMLEPRFMSTPTEATHYCNQCGTRYGGPGICTLGHPAAEVTPLSIDPAELPAAAPVAEEGEPIKGVQGGTPAPPVLAVVGNTGDEGNGGSSGPTDAERAGTPPPNVTPEPAAELEPEPAAELEKPVEFPPAAEPSDAPEPATVEAPPEGVAAETSSALKQILGDAANLLGKAAGLLE